MYIGLLHHFLILITAKNMYVYINILEFSSRISSYGFHVEEAEGGQSLEEFSKGLDIKVLNS